MKISDLHPVDYNPRIITNEQLKRLMLSIKEHSESVDNKAQGIRLATTITINKQGNRIVGGHQRVVALQALGQDYVHDDDITWVDLEPGSLQEKTLNIALNSEDAAGSYDYKKLSELLHEIHDAGLNVDLTALADYVIEPLMAGTWPEKKPGKGGGETGLEEGQVLIELTKEQREMVDNTVQRIRIVKDDEELSESTCVRIACEHFLEQHSEANQN